MDKQYAPLGVYEMILDAAEGSDDVRALWAAAIRRKGVATVSLLYRRNSAFRASLRDPDVVAELLEDSLDQRLFDVVDWVLARRADVSGSVDAFEVAYSDLSDYPLAMRLLAAGTDISDKIELVLEDAENEPLRYRPMINAAVANLSWMPGGLIRYAVRHDAEVLEALTRSSAPIEPGYREFLEDEAAFAAQFINQKMSPEHAGKARVELAKLARRQLRLRAR